MAIESPDRMGAERLSAFDALLEAVNTLLSKGRSTNAAAVKNYLQAQAGFSFDEKQLGYASFRAFLKAAQDAGRVTVRRAETGRDVKVFPARGTVSPAPEIVRIRSDVWSAFTRWGDGYIRLWDRQTDRALRIPSTASPSESPATAAIRMARVSDPDRFVTIDFIPPELLMSWALEWVSRLTDGAVRSALEGSLRGDLPIRNFTRLVKQLGLGQQWHPEHVRRVRESIEDWSAKNNLTVDLQPSAEPASNEFDERPAEQTARPKMDEVELRRQVREFVDKMTVPELLNLAIPLRITADI